MRAAATPRRKSSPHPPPMERSRGHGPGRALYSTALLCVPTPHLLPPIILMQMRPFQLWGPFEQQVSGAGKKPPEWAGAGQGWVGVGRRGLQACVLHWGGG